MFAQLKINSFNEKAKKYYGIHRLKNYNSSADFKMEILPNNSYLIYDDQDTVQRGSWKLVESYESTILFIDGTIFGTKDLKIR